MLTYILIPVKKLCETKKRLSAVLKAEERRSFALAMLKDVLTAVSSSSITRTVLISSDRTVKRLSSNYGVKVLSDTGDELNRVLEYATDWCLHDGAEAVLIFPADIPLIETDDIANIISLCSEKPSVVISPSHNGGTNALMRSPPDLIKTQFGIGSFKKHVEESSRKGLTVKIYESQMLSLDIDSTQDLRRFIKLGEGTESLRFLRQRGIDKRLEKFAP